MKILHLTLKKKWFEMIFSGEKKEEYREVKDYWMKRLTGIQGCGTSYNYTILHNTRYPSLNFDAILFKNGYSKNAPTMLIEFKGLEVKEGNKKWGAPNYKVFAIKLGKVISAHCHLPKDVSQETKQMLTKLVIKAYKV